MAYPTTYRHTKEHEWLDVSGNIGTVGITDYAQNTPGDIVFVELPKVGDTVTAINEELGTSPDKINEDAHHAWIIKVELSDPAQAASLLDAAAYEAFIAEEGGH